MDDKQGRTISFIFWLCVAFGKEPLNGNHALRSGGGNDISDVEHVIGRSDEMV